MSVTTAKKNALKSTPKSGKNPQSKYPVPNDDEICHACSAFLVDGACTGCDEERCEAITQVIGDLLLAHGVGKKGNPINVELFNDAVVALVMFGGVR